MTEATMWRGWPGACAAAGLALAGLAVTHAGPGITALAPVRRRLFPRLAGLGQADHVALTFDDGPDPASTPAFLDLLAARGLAGTTGTRSCAAPARYATTWPGPRTRWPRPAAPSRASTARPTGC